jgi:hypothetical protein
VTTTRATLVPHPTTPAPLVQGLGVHATLTASGRLQLHYVLRAPLAELAIPTLGPLRFRDELWRRTCFEAFVRADGDPAYREFNFAPSREWAAYAFTAQREGMRRLDQVVPALEIRRTDERLELSAAVELAGLYDSAWRTLKLAVTAVIEDAAGNRSYWALRHPAARPDFHHPGGFALTLS